MKLAVSLNNIGGPLDTRIVKNASEAHAAAIDLIAQAHVLYAGDTITVEEIEE